MIIESNKLISIIQIIQQMLNIYYYDLYIKFWVYFNLNIFNI